MNIAPTLPTLQPPAQQQERRVVTAVNASQRSRDATDEPGRRPVAQRVIDESRHARLVARAEVTATPQRGHSTYASRALASYARVADDGERRSLSDLLGFDDYA